jgi:hypothetical protein
VGCGLGGGSVFVKRAMMSVMTEGCEGRNIEGRHMLFGGV